jgi:hypothetical protein
VPEINKQKPCLVSNVCRIAVVVMPSHPFATEKNHWCMNWPIVQFQNVLHNTHIVNCYISCVLGREVEHRSDAGIVRLQSTGCFIFNAKVVPNAFIRVKRVAFWEGLVHMNNLSTSSGFDTSMLWGPKALRIQSSKAGILGSTSCSTLHFLYQPCIQRKKRVRNDYDSARI